MTRLREWLQFWLERQLVRGAHYRILVVAMLIGALSVVGGVLVHGLGTGFGSIFEAVWWAFLRLSDPGYLGDDEGTVNRVVSTLLTVLGYVVFLGSLVAIMTQWLNAQMTRLERGLTPVARRNHIVVLGWTNRTKSLVRELLLSEHRVRHFLRLRGARNLHVVVLAGEVTAGLVQELRHFMGRRWDDRRVTLRSGSALRPNHLSRVGAAHAAAIIIPGAEVGTGAERADSHAVKALLSLGRMTSDGAQPFVVAEVFQEHSVDLARQAYSGPLEVLASDAFVSRLLAQNLRHPGLSEVYNELLSNELGNEIYVRDSTALAGSDVATVRARFPAAVLLGLVRVSDGRFEPLLNPPPDTVVGPDDRLVLVAESFAATNASPKLSTVSAAAGSATPPPPPRPAAETRRQRILLLGWNHKVPALIRELSTYVRESFDVRIVSSLAASQRVRALRGVPFDTARVAITHVEANFTQSLDLGDAEPHAHDAIVLLGSDRFEAHEESDARTLMGYLVLEGMLPRDGRPPVLIELLDPENMELLEGAAAEVMISPMIVSHMLAQIALRRELHGVFDELFTAGGAEVFFRPATEYCEPGTLTDFHEIERTARSFGETALGVRSAPGAEGGARVVLNPDRRTRWRVDDAMQIVTLATYD